MADLQCYLCNSTARGSWLCDEHRIEKIERFTAAEDEMARHKADARSLLDEARERRERDDVKRPILDAFDRMSRAAVDKDLIADQVARWMPGFEQLQEGGCEHLADGWCYVIASSHEHVKIGSCRTSSPSAMVRRLRDLQAACPTALSLLRLYTGGLKREKAFHREFASHRTHHEWFSSLVIVSMPLSGCPDCDACVMIGGIHPDDLRLIRGEP